MARTKQTAKKVISPKSDEKIVEENDQKFIVIKGKKLPLSSEEQTKAENERRSGRRKQTARREPPSKLPRKSHASKRSARKSVISSVEDKSIIGEENNYEKLTIAQLKNLITKKGHLNGVEGTGKNGKPVKKDYINYLKSLNETPKKSDDEEPSETKPLTKKELESLGKKLFKMKLPDLKKELAKYDIEEENVEFSKDWRVTKTNIVNAIMMKLQNLDSTKNNDDDSEDEKKPPIKTDLHDKIYLFVAISENDNEKKIFDDIITGKKPEDYEDIDNHQIFYHNVFIFKNKKDENLIKLKDMMATLWEIHENSTLIFHSGEISEKDYQKYKNRKM